MRGRGAVEPRSHTARGIAGLVYGEWMASDDGRQGPLLMGWKARSGADHCGVLALGVLAFKGETHLQRDLEVQDFALGDLTPSLYNLEPAHVS